MAEDEKPGDEEKNDVLSNLPRSRRQRPSARREEAKAAARKANTLRSAAGNGGAPKGAGKKKSGAKPAPSSNGETTEKVAATPEPERSRKRVPASGYATVRQPGSYGNADPDELLKSFVRSILRRLPG